jgi:DNA processing protein
MAYDTVQVREQTTRVAPKSDMEHKVLHHLQADPIHIDDLVQISGLTIADVTSTLTILELKGLAQMVGHMQYSRTT